MAELTKYKNSDAYYHTGELIHNLRMWDMLPGKTFYAIRNEVADGKLTAAEGISTLNDLMISMMGYVPQFLALDLHHKVNLNQPGFLPRSPKK